MKKSVKITSLVCAAALLVSSVLSPASTVVHAKAKKPALSKKKLSVKIGKTAKLSVKRAKGWKISWKSKNKKIATVKKAGKYAAKITAKKKGSVKITATVKKRTTRRTLTCKVTVSAASRITPAPSTAAPSANPATQAPDNPDVPRNTPTATLPGSTPEKPTETAVPTVNPSSDPTAAPPAVSTEEPTSEPTEKPTTPPTVKPSVKPTVPTAAPPAVSTEEPTSKPTKKPTTPPTVKPSVKPTAPTATPLAPSQIPENAIQGSKLKGTTNASVNASVGTAGAVTEFKSSSQYSQADFLLAAPISLSTIENVEFTLSVKGTPDSVSFKLYDSDGKELTSITQYNKTSGTHSIKIPDELKNKIITQYSIMTNTNIKDSTQTATATLSKLAFMAPTTKPSASPAPTTTPQPAKTPAATDKPLITMAPEASMTLSEDTFLASGAAGEPVYNADGSVTITLKKEYGGGGVGFYMDASKSMVDLSDYSKVIFKISADAEAPICLRTHDTTDYWGANSSTLLSYTSITTEQKEYICDLSTINSTLGFGVKYNPGGSSDLPEEINLTIHSISFVKDTRDTTDAMNNYTSLAEMAAAYGLKMGTVMNDRKVADKKYGDLMKYHFNSITAANEMKAYSMLDLNKTKEAYTDENSMPVLNFIGADKIMDFAKANNIKVRGHALVWDAGMLDWFFREGYDSTKPYAKSEVVKARLQNYIEQVLVHFEEKYPGVIYCWDVVNEAVGDSEAEYEEGDERHVRTKRNNEDNPFYTLVGRDYVELSFQYTYEVLQELKKTMPSLDIKLYYNDYSTFYASKRDAIYNLVRSVNAFLPDDNGGYVKLCDGVGMQSYIGGFGQQPGCMNENDINLVKEAILKFASLGIEVQVTELAVRNYQNDAETLAAHGAFYEKLFQAYLELNSGDEKPLKAISIWGIIDEPDLKPDDYSFKMNGPYCGLFDENLAVKDAFKKVHDLMKNSQ